MLITKRLLLKLLAIFLLCSGCLILIKSDESNATGIRRSWRVLFNRIRESSRRVSLRRSRVNDIDNVDGRLINKGKTVPNSKLGRASSLDEDSMAQINLRKSSSSFSSLLGDVEDDSFIQRKSSPSLSNLLDEDDEAVNGTK